MLHSCVLLTKAVSYGQLSPLNISLKLLQVLCLRSNTYVYQSWNMLKIMSTCVTILQSAHYHCIRSNICHTPMRFELHWIRIVRTAPTYTSLRNQKKKRVAGKTRRVAWTQNNRRILFPLSILQTISSGCLLSGYLLYNCAFHNCRWSTNSVPLPDSEHVPHRVPPRLWFPGLASVPAQHHRLCSRASPSASVPSQNLPSGWKHSLEVTAAVKETPKLYLTQFKPLQVQLVVSGSVK